MFETAQEALRLAKSLQAEAPKSFVPPSEGTRPSTEQILPHALVRGTRGYLERVCFQINGCYEQGWFDACAVMMRRLVETLIIEAFPGGHPNSSTCGHLKFLHLSLPCSG
jgi:hypothetical protein